MSSESLPKQAVARFVADRPRACLRSRRQHLDMEHIYLIFMSYYPEPDCRIKDATSLFFGWG